MLGDASIPCTCVACNASIPFNLEFTPPSAPDPFAVDQTAVQGQINLAQLELARCEAVIEKLEQSCSSLKQFVAFQRWIISPIRRVPPEILACIFDMVCYPRIGLPECRVLPYIPALILSHVSRAWSTCATLSPGLWTNFKFGNPTELMLPTEANWRKGRLKARHIDTAPWVNAFELCLKLSGACPLSIDFRKHPDLSPREISPSFATLWSILVPAVPRWKSLTITADLLRRLVLLEGEFPLLHTLTLSSQVYVTQGDEISPPLTRSFWRRFPKLNCLHMASRNVRFALEDIPLENLTDFSYNPGSLIRGTPPLIAMPNLVSLTLTIVSTADTIVDTVEFPHLRRLHVYEKVYPVEDAEAPLRFMFCPSLLELSFKSVKPRAQLSEALYIFMSRSPLLEWFHGHCLRRFNPPSLFIDWIAQFPTTLRWFKLDWVSDVRLLLDPLLVHLEHREDSSRRIQSLEIGASAEDIDETYTGRLEALRETGLIVNIYSIIESNDYLSLCF